MQRTDSTNEHATAGSFNMPYADGWEYYHDAGWVSILPVDGKGKTPYQSTGYVRNGRLFPTVGDLRNWASTNGGDNLTLSPPAGVIGLDVDAYDSPKIDLPPGERAQRAKQWLADHPDLPPTYISSSRFEGADYDGLSGIRLYRVSEKYAALAETPCWHGHNGHQYEDGNGCIDLIRQAHRQVVCWPSKHKRGTTYRWKNEATGELMPEGWVPKPDDLPVLPDEYVEEWIKQPSESAKRKAGTQKPSTGRAAYSYDPPPDEWLTDGDPCQAVQKVLDRALGRFATAHRHDNVTKDVLALLRLGEQGHQGVRKALDELCQRWMDEMTDERGDDAGGEFIRMVDGGAAKIHRDGLTMDEDKGCCAVHSHGMRGVPGTAEHLIVTHLAEVVLKDRFLWCPQLGWMEYDGTVWKRHADSKGTAVKTAFRYYLRDWIRDELMNLLPEEVTALRRWMTINKLDTLERAAKTIRGVTVEADVFDADPMLLNTPSGVLSLSDGSMQPHDPDLRLTRITGASYRKGATHKDWTMALMALPGGKTVQWLQAYLGRGLIGHQAYVEYIPFLIGSGSNGKSLIIGAVCEAVGRYGGMVEASLLAGKVHEEHVARLWGMRLALVEELADGHRLNVARLKQMVGTEVMIGRHLYREPIEWRPTHTLCVTTNYHPVVPETDHGTWRRLRAVPFPYEFADNPEFKELVITGREQQEAVLAWLVEGAMMPMPPMPKAIDEATDNWRKSVDSIAQFLDECCENDLSAAERKDDVMLRFNEFLTDNGHRPMSARVFVERFRDHKIVRDWGVGEKKIQGIRCWAGLRLKRPVQYYERPQR